MENIKVESSKSYNQGFVLYEQELRRIIETCEEQYNKVKKGNKSHFEYQIRFENGIIAKTDSLDSIFKLENSGNSTITRIEISSKLSIDDNSYSIAIIFRNVDSNTETGLISVYQTISGLSRDWVFVTSSLLQERITKVKRWVPNQLGNDRSPYSRIVILSIIMFLMFIMIYPFLNIEKSKSESEKKAYLIELAELDTLRINGKLSDPIDAILKLETLKTKNELKKVIEAPFFSKINYKNIILPGLFIIFILFYLFLVKYYPAYCFCWGDYQEIFNKKESIRKTVFVVIIIGIVVSTIGSLIANRI